MDWCYVGFVLFVCLFSLLIGVWVWLWLLIWGLGFALWIGAWFLGWHEVGCWALGGLCSIGLNEFVVWIVVGVGSLVLSLGCVFVLDRFGLSLCLLAGMGCLWVNLVGFGYLFV